MCDFFPLLYFYLYVSPFPRSISIQKIYNLFPSIVSTTFLDKFVREICSSGFVIVVRATNSASSRGKVDTRWEEGWR